MAVDIDEREIDHDNISLYNQLDTSLTVKKKRNCQVKYIYLLLYSLTEEKVFVLPEPLIQ